MYKFLGTDKWIRSVLNLLVFHSVYNTSRLYNSVLNIYIKCFGNREWKMLNFLEVKGEMSGIISQRRDYLNLKNKCNSHFTYGAEISRGGNSSCKSIKMWKSIGYFWNDSMARMRLKTKQEPENCNILCHDKEFHRNLSVNGTAWQGEKQHHIHV